jgi:hypothetical protein
MIRIRLTGVSALVIALFAYEGAARASGPSPRESNWKAQAFTIEAVGQVQFLPSKSKKSAIVMIDIQPYGGTPDYVLRLGYTSRSSEYFQHITLDNVKFVLRPGVFALGGDTYSTFVAPNQNGRLHPLREFAFPFGYRPASVSSALLTVDIEGVLARADARPDYCEECSSGGPGSFSCSVGGCADDPPSCGIVCLVGDYSCCKCDGASSCGCCSPR